MTIELINDAIWERYVINNPRPTLVTFVSPHCSACDSIGWQLEAAAEQLPAVDVRACDVTASPDARDYYGIDGTPRTLLFVDGVERATLRGYQYAHTIVDFVRSHL